MAKAHKIPLHSLNEQFSGIYVSPLGIEKHDRLGYESDQPHRHDFYYCVLMENGRLELEVDFEKVRLGNGELYLSYPGQIHQVISVEAKQGWYIAFDPSFIEISLRGILDQFLSEVILVPLSAGQASGLSGLIRHLYDTYKDDTQILRASILQATLSAFVFQTASAYLSVERNNLIRHPARAVEITKQFKQLLRQNFRVMRKPSEFAAVMNLTLTHLNDTVRLVTGCPLTHHIQHELMREAQRLLSEPGATVKEAASVLGFDDDKYFNRMFNKVIGISPGMFRKRLEHLSF